MDAAAQAALLARPPTHVNAKLRAEVERLIDQVRADGDHSLRALTRRFDGCALERLAVAAEEFAEAERALDAELKAAIDAAFERIRLFHDRTKPLPVALETAPGVVCERLVVPIERVGLYVPAGSAPLPSTALMLGVPALIAGCPEVVLCSPPRADGRVDPSVLYAARRCRIERVFKLGGVQAIAAMAYGTESVPRCDKLYGPGNAYVTMAKHCVASDPAGPAIDLPAGPSEVLVIADGAADPDAVAADLLAQAEHGPDSQVILLSPDADLIEAVLERLERQLAALPRAAIARSALEHARAIQVADLREALALSNRYAPEHLILNVVEPRRWLAGVRNAGSVFLGRYTPESLGDYCSGTNHVLPTDGRARAYSGVSVASFVKQITVQEASAAGLTAIGPCAMTLARAEGLHAHAAAVEVRLAQLTEGMPA